MPAKEPKIKIRKIGPEEIPVLIQYRISYLTELQGEMNETYKNKLEKDLLIYFKKSISEGSFLALMAEVNGEMVSFGGMVIKKIPGDRNKTTYREGDILNMYTSPAFRQKGFSSIILKHLLEEAKKLGITKVALHTSKEAEKLYRTFNFSEPVYPYLERQIEDNTEPANE